MDKSMERAAMHGEVLPGGLSLAGQKFYLALRTLYRDSKAGAISKEDAAKEKKSLVEAYTMEHSKEEFLDRSTVSLQSRIETAAENFRKNRTLEAADAFYAAIYNVSEDWRSH